MERELERLEEKVELEATFWRKRDYYNKYEHAIERAWPRILSWIADADFSVVVDLAAGQGRNSRKLLERAQRLYIVDVLDENIDYCRERFAGDARVSFIENNGLDLAAIPDDAVTLVYCWDAMVHFESDIVRRYLKEFRRVLRPGGRAFCHHSNYTGKPGGFLRGGNLGPSRRNFMSKSLYAHYAILEGLEVVRQQVIDWTEPELDCLSLVQKPL